MHSDHHHAETAGLAAPHAAASVHPAGLASLGADGAVHVGISQPPRNGEPRELVGSGAGFRGHGQETVDTTEFASKPRKAQDLTYTDKTRATLAAMLAIKGYSLHELADGSFLASRWNHTRPLRDLHAVQGFARQVGAT